MQSSDLEQQQRPRRTQRRGRWWRRAGASVLILLTTALVAAAVIVNVGHFQLQPVLSGSMRPGIQPGDLAIIRPVPLSQVHTGEVVAYLPPGHSTPVMHRIVSITEAGIVTKGDANSVTDPWGRVKPASTVEHLVAVVPKLGWLGDVRRQLLVLAGAVLLLVAAGAFVSSLRKTEDHAHPKREDRPVSTTK